MMKKTLFLICLILLSGFLHANKPRNIADISIAKYKGDKVCAISYTFDDGLKEHYTLVLPQLERFGFKGTFWINGICINEDENSIADTTRMTWGNLREMANLGHEISNHSWSHPNFLRISIEAVQKEISKNDSVIFEKVGVLPRTFCYPFNARNVEVTELASINRVGTRTTQFGIGGRNSKTTPERLNEKIEELINTKEWGVAMIHGITYQYDAFYDPTILWNHWERVKSQEDKIWVGTFHEVVSYIHQRDNTRLVIKTRKNQITIIPESSLDKTLYGGLLTMVLKINRGKKTSVKQGKKELKCNVSSGKAVFDFDPYGEPIHIYFKH